jgi:hypothetical protein
LLLALPIINGMPSLFTDTKAYMVLGGYIAEKIGLSARGNSEAMLAGSGQKSTIREEPNERLERALSGAAARSPYYSFFLFVLADSGGFWLVAFAHALLAAALIDVVSYAANLNSKTASRTYWLTIGALAFASTLPLFVGFMMPDVFGGIGVIAVLTLLIFYEGLTVPERVFLVLLAALASLVHSTHVVSMAAAIIVSAMVLSAWSQGRRDAVALRSACLLLLACTGLVGALAYQVAARAVVKSDIHRPPFLMARILEDGPGRSYLRSACTKDPAAFELCRFIDRDLSDSQAFLWSREAPEGVFATADANTRRKLIEEEAKFVAGAVSSAPFEQMRASVRNIFDLITTARIDDVIDTNAVFKMSDFKMLGDYMSGGAACQQQAELCRRRIPDRPLAALDAGAAAFAFVAMVILLICRRTGADAKLRALSFGAGITLAIFSNAIICAVVSGPYPRYQSKMSWLLILGLCVVAQLMRNQQSERTGFDSALNGAVASHPDGNSVLKPV